MVFNKSKHFSCVVRHKINRIYKKRPRTLCAVAHIFTIDDMISSVVFYFSMPISASFSLFYRKSNISLFNAEKQSFSPLFSTQKRKRFTPFQSAKKVGFPYTNMLI